MKTCLLTGLMAGFFVIVQAQTTPTRSATGPLKETNPESLGMSTERLKRIDNVVNDYISNRRQANVAVLVARNGQIAYYKAYGQDDVDTKKPLQRDAIYRIASQTKAITSIAAMILYEEGKFLLDDPVSKYLPAFKSPKVLSTFNEKDTTFTTVPAKREITIRQLLTHTSGIGYPVIGSKEMNAIYAKYRIPSGIGTPDRKLDEAMTALAALPLAHQPGERWTYGLNDDLLGRLIEIWSGQSFDQFLRTRLFEPLGMNDTYFYLPTGKQNRLTTLYTEDSTATLRKQVARYGTDPNFPKQNGTYFSGGAGLSSTLMDYAIFLQMLLNGGEYNGKRILSAATVRIITSNQIGDLNQGYGKFGLGFGLTTERGSARLPVSEGTFEWGGIFGTTYWVDPKENIVALIYTQKFPNSYGDLSDKFKVLVYQAITSLNRSSARQD